MAKRMLIDALHPEEIRVVIADDNQIYDFDFATAAKKQLKGNIYLAKITRVEPSLQAAFVEYGGNKQGFLPFSEIHADYYQIPVSDRKRLMEEDEHDSPPEQSPAKPEAVNSEPSQDSSYGDQPLPEAAMSSDSLPSLPMGEEDAHPAYLTQGAIDLSVSETLESPESVEEAELSLLTAEEPAEAKEASFQPENANASSSSSEDVETIPNEEEEYQNRPKKNLFFKRYKIQEVIRRGQIVLVQVIKEERGNKGVSLTTYLSLAGRYCVLMPNSPKDGGISRKIASADDRKRLKSIYTELKLSAGMSVIIRTAGMDRTRAEIKRDYDYLVKLWNRIREDTLSSNAPALIYEESDVIKRTIRDQYSGDIEDIIVEGEGAYKAAKEFMKLLLPSHTPKIKHYKEPTPLFYAYNIEEQLLSMHDPVVKLRSGGYIVINPTEALISIDVNSGRATGERNIEETASKTNLEAAAEVARQLRLRDLAGLIVIDFIDMLESRNRRAVEKTLKDSLKADRAKIQLGRISPFGLLEMSRQRMRPSISETNMVQCPHCIGRGVIRSNESMSIQMIRAIEKEASSAMWSSLRLIAPQAVALHLLNTKRDVLRAIEERHGLSVQVLIGPELTISEFNLEKMRKTSSERSDASDSRRGRGRPERHRAEAPQMMEEANDNAVPGEMAPGEESEVGDKVRKPRERRNRRGGRGRSERSASAPAAEDSASIPETAEAGETPLPEGEESSNRHPRQRGMRGRRRWRDRDGDERGRPAAREAGHTEPAWENPAAGGNRLPAFAAEPLAPVSAPVPERVPQPVMEVAHVAASTSTPRDPNAPPKKGWWQKMIELDD